MNNLSEVFIAVPTRNHAWILPRYLESLFDLEYPKENISIYFLVNDTEDDTMAILEQFKEKHNHEYNSISFEEINYGVVRDKRDSKRNQLYPHFAMLKNHVRKTFLQSDCDFWLHVDTDIIMQPDTLNFLLRHNKGYVCGVCNTGDLSGLNCTNVMAKLKKRIDIGELDYIQLGQLFRAFWVGGIALIRRDIASICHYYSCKKRDDNLGFCYDVRKAGHEVWVDPQVNLKHCMIRKK